MRPVPLLLLLSALAAAPASAQDPRYASECWRLDASPAASHALVPAREREARIFQQGFGALSRRAAYNATGQEARSADVDSQQSRALRSMRLRFSVLPAVLGAGFLGSAAVLFPVAGAALVSWVLRIGPAVTANVPVLPWGLDRHGVSHAVFVTALVGLPLAAILAVAGLVPPAVGAYRSVQLASLPDSFLLDGDGFPLAEAQALVAEHNRAVSTRLGLSSVPVCNAP